MFKVTIEEIIEIPNEADPYGRKRTYENKLYEQVVPNVNIQAVIHAVNSEQSNTILTERFHEIGAR